MVQQVRKYPGQVSIYAGGALTNVALAVRMDPEFASLARELVVMGGYVDVNLLQTTGSVMQADINGDVSSVFPFILFVPCLLVWLLAAGVLGRRFWSGFEKLMGVLLDQPDDRSRSGQDCADCGFPKHQ